MAGDWALEADPTHTSQPPGLCPCRTLGQGCPTHLFHLAHPGIFHGPTQRDPLPRSLLQPPAGSDCSSPISLDTSALQIPLDTGDLLPLMGSFPRQEPSFSAGSLCPPEPGIQYMLPVILLNEGGLVLTLTLLPAWVLSSSFYKTDARKIMSRPLCTDVLTGL